MCFHVHVPWRHRGMEICGCAYACLLFDSGFLIRGFLIRGFLIRGFYANCVSIFVTGLKSLDVFSRARAFASPWHEDLRLR